MKKPFFVISTLIIALAIVQSCKKDEPETDADRSLYDEISSGTYSWYRDAEILPGVPPSPHGSFKLRFNQAAFNALDQTGELPEGESFPVGSILVKEIYSGNTLNLYAVMKKDPSNADAGDGWVWAEFNPDGSVAYSASKKGGSCISCHSGTPNRDLVRTFDLH